MKGSFTIIFSLVFLMAVASNVIGCNGQKTKSKSEINSVVNHKDSISDEELMDLVQRETFNYFWEGAEPTSGLARERIHLDKYISNLR